MIGVTANRAGIHMMLKLEKYLCSKKCWAGQKRMIDGAASVERTLLAIPAEFVDVEWLLLSVEDLKVVSFYHDRNERSERI